MFAYFSLGFTKVKPKEHLYGDNRDTNAIAFASVVPQNYNPINNRAIYAKELERENSKLGQSHSSQYPTIDMGATEEYPYGRMSSIHETRNNSMTGNANISNSRVKSVYDNLEEEDVLKRALCKESVVPKMKEKQIVTVY